MNELRPELELEVPEGFINKHEKDFKFVSFLPQLVIDLYLLDKTTYC
jgi:hypothetical protein